MTAKNRKPSRQRRLDPSAALDRVQDHFRTATPKAVLDAAKTSSPLASEPRQGPTQLPDLFHRIEPRPVSLNAYLATALTGLTNEQRQLVFHLSDTVALVCRELDIDVYEPRKKTDPQHHADVSDTEVFRIDRERVLRSDLLIHLCHFPSTGSGQELDFAYNALLPILLIRPAERRASRMITGIPSLKVEIAYQEPEELRAELSVRLAEIRPILEERKLAFSNLKEHIVGTRVRDLREGLQLSRQALAASVNLTEDGLAQIEDNDDSIGNPTLIQLRMLAAALRTTAAELVAPDISKLVVAELQDWVEGRREARFAGLSTRDRNKLVRRILLRVIDQIEQNDG